MAIGIKKFILSPEQTADSVIDYLTDPQSRGDYYSEGGQAVLRWLATPRLQRLFALGGPIVAGRTSMRMLFEGRHPVTGERIRRAGANGTSVGAIDVTLSPAPKSVSVLWALAEPELRFEIEWMVWVAADLAIYELMKKPLVRQRFGRGADNVCHEVMEDIIGVQTLHTTARLSERGDGVPDPQLHVHSLLYGAVDAGGQLRALDSHRLMAHQREIDAHASATLAEMLRLHGFPIVRTLDDRGRVSWELAGIPDDVLRIASSRRAEITAEGPGSLRELYRAWCRERYGAEREPTGRAWDEFLAAHRGPKATLQGAELRQAWADQYGEAGWGIQAALAYALAAARQVQAGIVASDDRAEAIQRFREEFLADLCREHALVPESHVDAMTFEKAKGLIDVTTALRVVGAMFSDGDLLVAPDGRVTTLEVVADEQRARSAAQALMDAAPGAPPDPEAVRRAVEEAAQQGLPFDEHQEAALRLATSGRRFVSITGQAGTGKGVTSGVIAPLWKAQGHEVIALAVAGRIAQQAGHDARADLARTIDGFVSAVEHGRRTVDDSTVLIVDEAAMIDHARYASLLEVAARAGAMVIQVGDDRQLSPVGPGGLWTLIHADAKARGLAAELRVVRRAYEAAEGQAWTDVREGRVMDALRHWYVRGRLRLYDSRTELLEGMVAGWWADAARGVIVVDTSNAERDIINRLAQDRRVEAGELGAEELALANGCRVRAGDRVIFRRILELAADPGSGRPPRIENGTEATISAIDVTRGMAWLVLHEPRGERMVAVGRDAVLNLAYARHVHLGQGMTVEGAGQVGVSTRTDREHFYVMVSRARAGAVIHAVRSEVAAIAAPNLGPVTERQEITLRRLGVADIPMNWTWVDASVEIDARQEAPLGDWAMDHLIGTMQADPALAAHLVALAIARRQAEMEVEIPIDQVASSVRALVDEHGASAWDAFLAQLQARREAHEAQAGLSRLLFRQGAKEAVGDRSVIADPVRNEARRSRADHLEIARDARPADVAHALRRAWHARREELAELPPPGREPDLLTLHLADGVEVTRGQVIRFGHPDWLAGVARTEVQPGDLGVVLGCHRGGITWDYATVELVGGRLIEVWQTAQSISVEPDLDPSVVRMAIPRPDQRDPAALNVLELVNGTRLMSGDRVRLLASATLTGATAVEAGSQGVVEAVDRHRRNSATVRFEDGRWASVYPLTELEIVQPAPASDDEVSTRPLPAANPLEQVARWEATERLPRALALLDTLGQLHVTDQPVREAARLWSADPQAAVVVETWAQVAAVRHAVAEQEPRQPDGAPATPTVLIAGPAYRSRLRAERAGEEALAPERAYVVAGLTDREALMRALSVAHESHLVTTPPDHLTAELQAVHAGDIAAARRAAEAEVAEVAPSLDLAVEVGRDQGDARREAEREGAGR